MAICKRILLVTFVLLCLITITAEGKSFYIYIYIYIYSSSLSKLIFLSAKFDLLHLNFLQHEVCKAWLLGKLPREMMICLHQTKNMKRTMMNQCLWITLQQKRILQSITKMPAFVEHVQAYQLLYHSYFSFECTYLC